MINNIILIDINFLYQYINNKNYFYFILLLLFSINFDNKIIYLILY